MLKDLVKYYDKLYRENKVPPFGYNEKNISYMIDLDENGNIQDIIDIRVLEEPKEDENSNKKKQKKEPVKHGIRYRVPDDLINTSKPWPMYLFGRADYMFPNKDAKKKKKFLASAAYYEKTLKNVYDKTAIAIVKYFKNAAPVDFKAFDIDNTSKEFESAYFSFRFHGQDALNNQKLLEVWNNRKLPGPVGYSHISGKKNILRQMPQPKIFGVKGGQATGAALISRDRPSFAFNVRGGSINPNDNETPRKGSIDITWEDAFKYATALNWLLNPFNHHCKNYGKLTIVFWSEGLQNDEEIFDDFVNNTVNNSNDDSSEKPDKNLYEMFDGFTRKIKIDTDQERISEEIPFHICGFLPNSGRTLWAMDINNSLGDITENVKEHLRNMATFRRPNGVPLWKIPKLTVKDGQKIDNETNLYKQLLAAVFEKQQYPQQLVYDLIHRMTQKTAANKSEISNKNFLECKNGVQLSIEYAKYIEDEASMIKAILIRNYKKGDDIHMALNKDNPSIAYQFGRLFAAAQLDIKSKNPDDRKNMQKVKEKWLRAAVETPGKIYAEFLMSANLHNASNMRIGEIMDRIDAEKIPKRFSQEEKLQWFLGYYQEAEVYWKEVKESKEKKEAEEKAKKEKEKVKAEAETKK